MASRTFIRDDRETEVEVEYTICGGSLPQTYGPPESCDPGEPVEVEITSIRPIPDDDASAPDIELTDDERERLEQEVNEDPETWDAGDDYYPEDD